MPNKKLPQELFFAAVRWGGAAFPGFLHGDRNGLLDRFLLGGRVAVAYGSVLFPLMYHGLDIIADSCLAASFF